jgi:hypothetical protein
MLPKVDLDAAEVKSSSFLKPRLRGRLHVAGKAGLVPRFDECLLSSL